MSAEEKGDEGEGVFLVVGLELRTPIDHARELDRAMRHYAHVYACLAEVADYDRRLWLICRTGPVLEELAIRGDEGAGIEIERRRWSKRLGRAAEEAAKAGVGLNVPAFDPDRPLGPGTMVRWAQQGPLDYAGRLDPNKPKFRLGAWVARTTLEEKQATRAGGARNGRRFRVTDRLPWHDKRVPESGAAAEEARRQAAAGVAQPVVPQAKEGLLKDGARLGLGARWSELVLQVNEPKTTPTNTPNRKRGT